MINIVNTTAIWDSANKDPNEDDIQRCLSKTANDDNQIIANLANFVYGGESRTLAFQIVNALRWGDRTKASNLLLSYTAGSHALNKDDFVLIFDYCARSSDPLFVMEMWRILEEKSIAVGDKCYLLIIHALCHGGYLEEAFRLVKFLRESHQISCILPLYNYFLSACVKMQSLMHVNQCLDLMDYQMVGKNEITYTALLKLAVWQQNLSAVRGIWKQYIKYYNINIISLRKFIWSFTRLKDLESAYETLQHMVALAFKEGTSLKRTPEGKLCCPRLDIPIPSDNDIDMKRYNMNSIEHLATSIFDEEMNIQASVALQHAGFDAECGESRTFGVNMLKGNKSMLINKVLRWSFNDVIHACAQTQNSWLAEQLILQMQTLGLEPSCHTYDGFIRAIISEKGFGDGMKVLRIMEKSNLKPYESTVATLSIGCSRGFDLDLAEDLLDQISESPCAYPYNVFLEACDTMDQPERAVRMLAKMIRLKVKMDIKTYELLFSLFGNVNAPYEEGNMLSQVDAAKRINAIEMDMLRNGIQHSQLSIKNLLRALGSEGMIRELIQYLRIAENQFSHNTFLEADIYNTVLHSLVEAKESHMAIEIFRNMKLCGFWPDAATYNIMIDCCSNIRSFKSACALVSMMVRDGFYPQTLTYTSLIKILLECDDFDEALNLLDQAISEGNQPDVLLFNTILNKAYLQGRIDVIELTIERMHEEKIQPDSSTCNYVFSAYADRELFSTAVEALQVLSMRMISENDSALEEKRMEFEEFIQAEDPEAEMRIMHTFSHSEDLAAALFNLRWCAMIGFSISWPPNHSLWARRLVRTYGTQKRVA
ncbi:hypothetical protein Nepgr_020751 [Nepenthes gracilis]|uniref:Pentatricopeptide repeat-containing protein n=1 Tax=Nepenthes gracilis TaxID=150966 RepID=A0AAD3SXF0_NEPGR|nr:hypothetical protein Nepgr_020751 [Nepenthes gracilis]